MLMSLINESCLKLIRTKNFGKFCSLMNEVEAKNYLTKLRGDDLDHMWHVRRN